MNSIKSIFLASTALYCSLSQANVIEHFNQIKADPNALYVFFKQMPKGGELHYHLAGGPYPETMLKLVASANYCINKTTLAVSKSDSCDGVKTTVLYEQPAFYSTVVKNWSMKDFVPGIESGHDHFFNGFIKYMPIVFDFRPQLVADVMQRAGAQNEEYLELLDLPDNANSINFGALIKNTPSYDKKRQLLLADTNFQNNIATTINESENMLSGARKVLGCEKNASAEGCSVQIKLLYYVLREQPLNNMFAQTLNAFEAVSRSNNALVGVNLVQPEDGMISLRDYHKQMRIFQYFHTLYPKVKISLHAGELTSNEASPEHLRDHVHAALFTGNASRIGHGIDISHENKADESLQYMAKHEIPVEINLISNQKILNVSGKEHPLTYYLSYKVPVVLSTDDEGVLRTDLTAQYVAAVIDQGLDYKTLKQINRNALTYAFLPGQSLWSHAANAQLRQECLDLTSDTCQTFIKDNPKAQLQWNLERKLSVFENQF